MEIIKRTTNDFIAKQYAPQSQPQTSQAVEAVNFFYKSQMHSRYKQEEDTLRKYINKHVKPLANVRMKLLIYYKNRTVANLFVRNNPHRQSPEQRSHVVYRYTCKAEECHPSEIYIGQTTTSLKQRMTTHAQNGSIKNHNHDKHQRRLRASEILLDVDVLHSAHDRQELVLAEALLIKKLQPTINSQREGEVRVLSIF